MSSRTLDVRLGEIRAAEERLLRTVGALSGAALGSPSLLPGWSRGHVLAHVALNAHSLVNLLEWARTGTETPQYPSWEERDEAIERYSARTLPGHRTALREAGAAFEAAARRVPADRWSFEVSGIGGDPVPVQSFLFGRLREVEIHHVDLDAGYALADWPEAFVRKVLDEVPGRLSLEAEPPFAAVATDLGTRLQVGAPAGVEVSGEGRDLLAWLLGRSDGSTLEARGGGLPDVPPWG